MAKKQMTHSNVKIRRTKNGIVMSGFSENAGKEMDRLMGDEKTGEGIVTFFKEGFVVAQRILEFEIDDEESKPNKKKDTNTSIYG